MITTVELFAGIGGFRIATDRLGLKTIWANDINKKACSVYESNFGKNSIVRGDINELIDRVPEHDLLTAGFPCQPFSSAGKKKGIRDARGTLFKSIVDVVQKKQPKYFVLENVKRLISMNKGIHFATILSALSRLDYLIEWRVMNASHLGLAQNRERVIITGRRADMFTQMPADNLVLFGESEMNEMLDDDVNCLHDYDNWRSIEKHSNIFCKWGVAYSGKFFDFSFETFCGKNEPVMLSEVLEDDVDERFDLTESTLGRLSQNTIVNKYYGGVQIHSNQRGGARMGYTIFGTNGLSPTLTASTSRHYERYRVEGKYRRLTNVEYARLQGFPDNHCGVVSLQHQYILYGNAVPPNIVEWVISKLLQQAPVRFHKPIKQPLNLLVHA